METTTKTLVPTFTKKKNIKRAEALIPNGIPRYIRCYDSGGERFADRYTVVFTGRYTHNTGGAFWYLGMNAAPFHPQGIGMHGETQHRPCDRPTYSHLGKKIKFEDLPEDCQKLVMRTYLYLWDFTDDSGKEI